MEGPRELSAALWLRAVRAVLPRPSLWATAVVEAAALAEAGWWRRPPFLPVPSRELMSFRMVTAYGDPGASFGRGDLLTWLRWCRDWRRRHR